VLCLSMFKNENVIFWIRNYMKKLNFIWLNLIISSKLKIFVYLFRTVILHTCIHIKDFNADISFNVWICTYLYKLKHEVVMERNVIYKITRAYSLSLNFYRCIRVRYDCVFYTMLSLLAEKYYVNSLEICCKKRSKPLITKYIIFIIIAEQLNLARV